MFNHKKFLSSSAYYIPAILIQLVMNALKFPNYKLLVHVLDCRYSCNILAHILCICQVKFLYTTDGQSVLQAAIAAGLCLFLSYMD